MRLHKVLCEQCNRRLGGRMGARIDGREVQVHAVRDRDGVEGGSCGHGT
jgi:hypothetical protein